MSPALTNANIAQILAEANQPWQDASKTVVEDPLLWRAVATGRPDKDGAIAARLKGTTAALDARTPGTAMALYEEFLRSTARLGSGQAVAGAGAVACGLRVANSTWTASMTAELQQIAADPTLDPALVADRTAVLKQRLQVASMEAQQLPSVSPPETPAPSKRPSQLTTPKSKEKKKGKAGNGQGCCVVQ